MGLSVVKETKLFLSNEIRGFQISARGAYLGSQKTTVSRKTLGGL